MRIMVISLERAHDRRRVMMEKMASQGLKFEFLDAKDGRSISDQERSLVDHRKRQWISSHPLTDNEIGCWISHQSALSQIASGSSKMALVMEDDAELSSDIVNVLHAIEEKTLPFDFIFLHHNPKKRAHFMSCRPLMKGYSLGRIGPMSMGAVAYVVSQEGAKKFLSYAPRFVHSLDKEIHRYWANGLDIYSLNAPVAWENKKELPYSYNNETRKITQNYADAELLLPRMKRLYSRVADSLIKRIMFYPYVQKGRKLSEKAHAH